MNINVGTDCSGIEAPIQAIHKLMKKYNISYTHKFSSEIDPYALEVIKANYQPEIIYGDMKKRDLTTLPEIDLYVSGFPCQPFSLANKFKTPVDPRLNLFQNCLDVIFNTQPSCFILENVQTLTTLNKGSYFKEILQQLQRPSPQESIYEIHYQLMNTKDYGIPQSRKRLYIIGIRRDKLHRSFQFPKHKKMKSLSSFIDKKDTTKFPIKEANKELFSRIPKDSIFIDVGFRNCSFPNSGQWAPCITAQPNMWCVPMGRKANINEYLKLQGFPTNLKQPISDHQMKIKIGNSMTVDVIEQLLEKMFLSVGWI